MRTSDRAERAAAAMRFSKQEIFNAQAVHAINLLAAAIQRLEEKPHICWPTRALYLGVDKD
jgi:hypothetical protein